jgi:hypothetical protein
MTRRHIVIARRLGSAAPHVWARADWDNGWFDASTTVEKGSRSVSVQSNLAALVEGALTELGEADLTLTPRSMSDVIERGDPAGLDVPLDSSLDVLCPLGREDAPHEADIWVRGLVQPSAGLVRLLLDKKFTEKRLIPEVKAILSADDLKERCRPHDNREFWIRRDVTAAMIDPAAVPPYAERPALLEGAALTQAQRAEQRARADRARTASRKSAEASAFDKAAAKEFSEKQSAARARAAKK